MRETKAKINIITAAWGKKGLAFGGCTVLHVLGTVAVSGLLCRCLLCSWKYSFVFPQMPLYARGKGREERVKTPNVMKIFLPKTAHLSCLLIAQCFQEGGRVVLFLNKSNCLIGLQTEIGA